MRRIANGELKSIQLVDSCLHRIKSHDSLVNAWAWVARDAARAAATRCDEEPHPGLLRGVPVGIKDVIDTADMPTSYGSPIYTRHRPLADAACVAALRNHGAIILGKTVTTEFAYNNPATTVNPLDPARTPGGSSSGSAAAVADGMVPAAVGTQTVGSIIRPASYCGVVGYKPTFNLVNRAGLKICSESFDTIGVMTRTVQDAALLTAVMAERPELIQSAEDDVVTRIAFCKTHEWCRAEPATRKVLAKAVELLREAGIDVQEHVLPDFFKDIANAHLTVMATETRRALGHEIRTSREKISAKMMDVLQLADVGTSSRYDKALRYIDTCRRYASDDLFREFGDCDAILAPSAPGEAPKDLSTTGDPVFSFVWMALNLPTITIPGLSGPGGMPVGVQLIGRLHEDRRLLRVAEYTVRILAARRCIKGRGRRRFI